MNNIPHSDQLTFGIPKDIVEENWLQELSDNGVDMSKAKIVQESELDNEADSESESDQESISGQIQLDTSDDGSSDVDVQLPARVEPWYGFEYDEITRAPIPWRYESAWSTWVYHSLHSHSVDSDLIQCRRSKFSIPIHQRISPQLLLHRIILVFGTPYRNHMFDWEHHAAWRVKLCHRDKSCLTIWEEAGKVKLFFQGSNKTTKDAIKLISLLTSSRRWGYPDWYDGPKPRWSSNP